MDHISYTIVIEEIARVCASTSVILSVQNSLYCDPIYRFGTEEQKQKFLVPFARGEKIGCYALTEPQAGSNAAALQTKAVRKGDKYVINGTKAWITNGGAADAAIVYVNTQPEKGEKGITALVVEKGTRGFSVGKEEKKLGIHGTACTELVFSDCVVPASNRIGEEGEGYKVALSTLDGGRIGIAAQATGMRKVHSRRRFPMRSNGRLSGTRSRIFRRFSSCWRTWQRKLMRRDCWRGGRLGNRIQARVFRWKRRLRNYLRAKCPRVCRTRRFRFTGAMAIAASTRSSARIAMRASLRFTRGPAKSSAS